jgi:GTP-binding protein HflX
MEVISARQRRAFQTMTGEGESQLEIERRNIKDKEAKIRKAVEEESRLRLIRNDKSQKKASKVPVIALVGYTNVGKSAFMNAVMKKK